MLVALPTFLAACGGGISQEELETAQTDLRAAKAQVQMLEAEKLDLEIKVLERALEGIGTVVAINDLIAFPPSVVELKSTSAIVQMVTKLPTTCSIAHGITTGYGQISTDDSMSPGGHPDHSHTLEGLQPDSVHHYKWGLLGPDGTLYGSKDLTFKTPPARAGAIR